MSIPKWRVVEYTDDGCSIFQCLNCYDTWEGRTPAGYSDFDGTYTALWRFCPCCGIQWEGSAREQTDEYGPRRTRILKAVDDYRHANWDRYYNKVPPRYWWVIEHKYTFRFMPTMERWEPQVRYTNFKYGAKEMLARKNEAHAEALRDCVEDSTVETRLVMVRDLEAHYGRFQSTGHEGYR